MPSVDLLQRLKRPVVGAAPQRGRPWEDGRIRTATTQIQRALRQDCPGLLSPTDRSPGLHAELLSRIQSYLSRDPMLQVPGLSLSELAYLVFDYVAGLGPIGPLLEQPEISEIMVNRHDDIWVEIDGRLQRLPDLTFRDDAHVFHIAQRVMAPLGIELSAAHPMAEGRLPGNMRVAASMPPMGPNTTLTV
jgi:pilus assembly protein CpaF